MERETHIWDALPDNLLCSILARLPVRDVARMRVVCKRWKDLLPPRDALQRIDPNFSVNSTPAFLIQLFMGFDPRNQGTWVIELKHGCSCRAVISIYSCRCPIEQIVVDGVKSICLCMRNKDRLDLSLCNPATRTWRQLPRAHLRDWNFNAMTFDATRRRCTVLLGQNNVEDPTGNSMALQIYDSESNVWTRVSTKVPPFIEVHGKGLYSNGKFYWIILWKVKNFVVAAFDIAESSWTQITLPEVCTSVLPYVQGSVYLSGCDGEVVLILQWARGGSIRMWKLNDCRDAAEWNELHEISIPECHKIYLAAVNRGWLMMFDGEMEVYFCNLERKTTHKFSIRGGIGRDLRLPQMFLSAFESNNVWWP